MDSFKKESMSEDEDVKSLESKDDDNEYLEQLRAEYRSNDGEGQSSSTEPKTPRKRKAEQDNEILIKRQIAKYSGKIQTKEISAKTLKECISKESSAGTSGLQENSEQNISLPQAELPMYVKSLAIALCEAVNIEQVCGSNNSTVVYGSLKTLSGDCQSEYSSKKTEKSISILKEPKKAKDTLFGMDVMPTSDLTQSLNIVDDYIRGLFEKYEMEVPKKSNVEVFRNEKPYQQTLEKSFKNSNIDENVLKKRNLKYREYPGLAEDPNKVKKDAKYQKKFYKHNPVYVLMETEDQEVQEDQEDRSSSYDDELIEDNECLDKKTAVLNKESLKENEPEDKKELTQKPVLVIKETGDNISSHDDKREEGNERMDKKEPVLDKESLMDNKPIEKNESEQGISVEKNPSTEFIGNTKVTMNVSSSLESWTQMAENDRILHSSTFIQETLSSKNESNENRGKAIKEDEYDIFGDTLVKSETEDNSDVGNIKCIIGTTDDSSEEKITSRQSQDIVKETSCINADTVGSDSETPRLKDKPDSEEK